MKSLFLSLAIFLVSCGPSYRWTAPERNYTPKTTVICYWRTSDRLICPSIQFFGDYHRFTRVVLDEYRVYFTNKRPSEAIDTTVGYKERPVMRRPPEVKPRPNRPTVEPRTNPRQDERRGGGL